MNKNNLNKKGMAPSSVVLYLLALIVGGLILLYGFRAISSIVSTGEKALYLKFEGNIKSDLKEIAGLPGTVRILEYNLPSKFETVCFFEFGKHCSFPIELSDSADVICDSVDSNVANIFLLPLQENDINIENIVLNTNPLCLKIGTSHLKFKATGKGKTVLLEKVS